MARKFETLASAMQYMDIIGRELYELESRVKEIKNSPEFKKYQMTLGVYANRGIIDEAPSFKNGYKVPDVLYINDAMQKTEDFLKKFS